MDNTLFMHYRSYDDTQALKPCGGVTVAIRPRQDGSIVLAMAKCNDKDVFNKKMGRSIASGRLLAYESGRDMTQNVMELCDVNNTIPIKETVHNNIGQLMNSKGFF